MKSLKVQGTSDGNQNLLVPKLSLGTHLDAKLSFANYSGMLSA
jgi:hypothetical protein